MGEGFLGHMGCLTWGSSCVVDQGCTNMQGRKTRNPHELPFAGHLRYHLRRFDIVTNTPAGRLETSSSHELEKARLVANRAGYSTSR